MADVWAGIAEQISQAIGQPFQVAQTRSVGGGCINQAYGLSDGQTTFFVKLNQASKLAMFEAELAGLKEMVNSHTIRKPQQMGCGIRIVWLFTISLRPASSASNIASLLA